MEDQRFLQAAALLPARMRRSAAALKDQKRVEELRLRCGFPVSVVRAEGEEPLPGCTEQVGPADLAQVLETATGASAHTALANVQNGFFTARGGHRIGLCGTAVLKEGVVCNLRALSSVSIRIAREQVGAARPVLDQLKEDGRLVSTLILSPPGGGKTTLLRDLIRAVSDGDGTPAMRVGVADERGEVAAVWEGRPQLHVGAHTDVMDGCPKGEALMMLLRGMNPQVLAADEITAPADVAALETAANCGVTLLATAHAAGVEDLSARPLYRQLLDGGVFRRVVLIHRIGTGRRYEGLSLRGRIC